MLPAMSPQLSASAFRGRREALERCFHRLAVVAWAVVDAHHRAADQLEDLRAPVGPRLGDARATVRRLEPVLPPGDVDRADLHLERERRTGRGIDDLADRRPLPPPALVAALEP